MGQSGQIVFFSRDLPPNPRNALEQLLRLAGHDVVMGAERTIGQDVSWERWQYERRFLQQRGGGPLLRWKARHVRYKHLGSRIDSVKVPLLYRSGSCLRLFVGGGGPLAEPVYEAVLRIPNDIRDTFAPGCVGIHLGWHDLFETSENEDGTLFGRAGVSVHIEGQGCPSDWRLCRELILALPEVTAARTRIEAVLGSLETCAYWNA